MTLFKRRVIAQLIIICCLPGVLCGSCMVFSSSHKKHVKEVKQVLDVPYLNDDIYKHKMDIFLPEGEKNFPMILFIHGGGWHWGDRRGFMDIYGDMGRSWAAHNIGTAVISYRLGDEHLIDEQISDVAAAVAWIYKNAEKFNADNKKLIVCGHSAGAHLAAMIAFDPEWLGKYGLNTNIIKGLILWSGLYDINESIAEAKCFIRKKIWHPVFGKSEQYWKRMSPVTFIMKKNFVFSKILILCAEQDYKTIKAQSRKIAGLLGQNCMNGVEIISGEGHFSEVFHADEEGNPGFEKIVGFAKSFKESINNGSN